MPMGWLSRGKQSVSHGHSMRDHLVSTACSVLYRLRAGISWLCFSDNSIMYLCNRAGKPVMEGKSVLFKKFADLDAFDIEIQQEDPQKLVDIIVALEPTFGGVNLEDIKAPECFFVERECQARMNIPVFHDDQHGTAIIAGAGGAGVGNKDKVETVDSMVCMDEHCFSGVTSHSSQSCTALSSTCAVLMGWRCKSVIHTVHKHVCTKLGVRQTLSDDLAGTA